MSPSLWDRLSTTAQNWIVGIFYTYAIWWLLVT